MSQLSAEEQSAKNNLIAHGYNAWVAEALACRGWDWTDDALFHHGQLVSTITADRLMEEVLGWNGIHGYTGSIIAAIDNIRNVEAL